MSDVLVVGAGISGLLCAEELRRAGMFPRILDKGRGPGGRMASRGIDGARWDHGARFFTVRDPRFQFYVDEWLNAGVAMEWFRQHVGEERQAGHPRYRGRSGMNGPAKHLAKNLELHSSEKVVHLERASLGWRARCESGNVYEAKRLVLTAPLPQTMELLDASGARLPDPESAALGRVTYEKGLSTLAVLDGPSGLPEPGCMRLSGGVVEWIEDERMKGISREADAVTLQADPAFAEIHWDSSDAERGRIMLDAASAFIQSNVVDFHCHRWGFATARETWPQPFFASDELGLILAGDAFGGPRIEGAALSGLAAAAEIIGRKS